MMRPAPLAANFIADSAIHRGSIVFETLSDV
jgi:hypothetical protein